MSLNKKLRTCILIFILLISSFSIFVISPENVKGFFGDEELTEEQLILFGFHPFVTGGWYIYDGDKPLKISGDITFDIYYYNTFFSQSLWKDDLKVTLYKVIDFIFLQEVENGNTTVTLEPEQFGDIVQNRAVTLNNVNLTLDEGDMLLFAVKIIQSDKPIANIISRRLGNNFFDKVKNFGEKLNNSNNEELRNIGNTTLEFLGLTEEAGISEEDIASLLNSFTSSKFVYNSPDYPSSVSLPFNSTDNLTLYFHTILDGFSEDLEEDSFGAVFMSEEAPNGTSYTWPAGVWTIDGEENFDNFLQWFLAWSMYISGGLTPDEIQRNIITFYLNENKLVTEKPTNNKSTRLKLKKDNNYKWSGMTFSRNRIINNVSADLYMYYSKILLLRKITVNATIYDETEKKPVASVVKQLDRIGLLELIFRKPNSPTIFEFKDAEEKELWYNHEYSLILSYTGGPLLTLRTTHLLYNSNDCPSSVTFELDETDNIKITNEIEDKKEIIPGGSTEFEFDIESVYSDTLNIEVVSKYPEDLENFDIEIPSPVDIGEGGKETIKVKVTSKNDFGAAYGEEIDLTFNIIGNTGYVSKKSNVEVTEYAADYYIEVYVPKGKEIKHGESGEYTFKIKNKNTGYMDDEYEITASSEHNWPVEVVYDDEAIIEVGEELVVKVSVLIPAYTKIESDKLSLLIKSIRSEDYIKLTTEDVEVTTTVIGPNILESIYRFFENAGFSIGLDDVLGGYAPAFLIFIVIFIIVIFLFIIIYFIRIKYVDIICVDRIKEIGPDDIAEFDLEIKNPYKRKLTYEIRAEVNSDPESWDINLETESIIVESKDKQAIKLTVEPTDFAKQDEWVEIKIIATALEKNKGGSISTVTSIKDAKPDVRLLGIFHWPKVFKKDQKIVTSFRVDNMGKVSTDKISVILYVNGEEKNKVEDIIIPRGGYAEIEMPWIAVKGKNKVDIVVK